MKEKTAGSAATNASTWALMVLGTKLSGPGLQQDPQLLGLPQHEHRAPDQPISLSHTKISSMSPDVAKRRSIASE